MFRPLAVPVGDRAVHRRGHQHGILTTVNLTAVALGCPGRDRCRQRPLTV